MSPIFKYAASFSFLDITSYISISIFYMYLCNINIRAHLLVFLLHKFLEWDYLVNKVSIYNTFREKIAHAIVCINMPIFLINNGYYFKKSLQIG